MAYRSNQPGGVNQYFAKDAASFSLHYFDGDYASIGSATEWLSPMTWLDGQTPKQAAMNQERQDLWNGNISSMWTNLANPGSDMAGDNWGMLGMVYRYDQLNRSIGTRKAMVLLSLSKMFRMICYPQNVFRNF